MEKAGQIEDVKLKVRTILPAAEVRFFFLFLAITPIQLISIHMHTFFYRVRGSSALLPSLFKGVTQLQEAFNIEDYSITQVSYSNRKRALFLLLADFFGRRVRVLCECLRVEERREEAAGGRRGDHEERGRADRRADRFVIPEQKEASSELCLRVHCPPSFVRFFPVSPLFPGCFKRINKELYHQ